LTQLDIEDFAAFFAEAHQGRQPFPWQARLVKEAGARMADSSPPVFPALLDLPTGAGKTSIIDIFVFLQALEAAVPADLRVVPRRMVFVVDRRVIVDQVDEHARQLAQRLSRAVRSDGVLGEVARALKSIHGRDGEAPLRVASLRGGIVRDETWARQPDVPLILCSTIDQVGSRLLFRGYGLSDGTKPIHAGLLGTDTLFVLDEVHLSVPFAQTLRSLGEHHIPARDPRLPSRWEVVELSATADTSSPERVFGLTSEDSDPDISPVLARRLAATKPATLLSTNFSVTDDARLAKLVTQEVQDALSGGSHPRVLVVVNRVSRAVACAAELAQRAASRRPGELAGARVELLTGRMRGVERESVMARVKPFVESGADLPSEPLIVVSTQAIEAGADFDFDALITECASIDALRQRFGRVDRLGQCADRGVTARGVVIARDGEVKSAADPLYGDALARTWRSLKQVAETTENDHPVVDFGVGFPTKLADDTDLLPPRGQAPVLFPQFLDAWSQTSPIPAPDPDPALWLHGLEPSDPDVAIVWRADLTQAELNSAREEAGTLKEIVDAIALIPPGPSESLNIPVSQARAWLAGQPPQPLSDADASEPAAEESKQLQPPKLALAWRGEASEVVTAGDIRPGDVLVVPSTFGGIGTQGTWDPLATQSIEDVAEVDQVGPLRRRPVLRLNPEILGMPVPEFVEEETSADTRQRLRTYCMNALDEVSEVHSWPDARKLTMGFFAGSTGAMKVYRDRSGWILVSAKRISVDTSHATSYVEVSSEGSSFASVEVSLADHTSGVAQVVSIAARNCGLPPVLVKDLELAAMLHDIGKLDPRFQAMLAYPQSAPLEPLGKSAHGSNRDMRDRARAMAKLPQRFDHAVLGQLVLAAHPELLAGANDPDLVVHLVASHHGQCRPFAWPVPELVAQHIRGRFNGVSIDVTPKKVDDGVSVEAAERFFRLRHRYGWYGLAYLEAILRLADWTRSEQEQIAGGQ
jgi:CRISPR-associated endonuclease/helicase Cas3